MENKLEWEQRIWKDCRSFLGVPLPRPYRLITLRSSCWTNGSLPGMPSCKSPLCVICNKGENIEHSKVIFEMSTKYYKWYKYLLSKYSMFLFHSDKFGFFFQFKHFRALQEQARTYLDLLCSMCDLSNSSVKTTAKDIQQTEQMVKS